MAGDASKILIVEDDRLKRLTLEEQISKLGYEVASVPDGFGALRELETDPAIGLVLTDLKMPGMDGLELLRRIKSRPSGIDVIVMTAYGTVETAVEAIKVGAFDYVQKPFVVEELTLKLDRLLERRRAETEIAALRSRLEEKHRFHRLAAVSRRMREIFDRARSVVDDDAPVVILGETGTGKEMLAQSIHYCGKRKSHPFVALSCATLNPNLLESEIFGHEPGAFTGAVKRKRGRLELAGTGTLFLDDIDDIPLDLQARFLRVLQDRAYERVGGEERLTLGARIVAATKKDLRQLVKEGKFRDDLMYRLDVVRLELPPLRERTEDVPILLEHFQEKYGLSRSFSSETLRVLLDHDWPGNVRELENVVQQVKALGGEGVVRVTELPRYLTQRTDPARPYELRLEGRAAVDLPSMLREIEETAIDWAMVKAGGNKSRAAEILNLPRTTLRRLVNDAVPADEERDARIGNPTET